MHYFLTLLGLFFFFESIIYIYAVIAKSYAARDCEVNELDFNFATGLTIYSMHSKTVEDFLYFMGKWKLKFYKLI